MNQIYLIAHNIRSLHNIGAFLRTADCFGVKKIFLTGYTAAPENIIQDNNQLARQKQQISKTALGADDWIPWEQTRDIENIINKLKKQDITIYALETGKNTQNITNSKLKFPCALIIGNEIEGIPKNILKLADDILSIPMQGKKESLNVSVAAGIALYEFQNQKSNPPS